MGISGLYRSCYVGANRIVTSEATITAIQVRCIGGALDGKSFWTPMSQLKPGTKINLNTVRPAKYDSETGEAYDDNIVDLFGVYEVQLLTMDGQGYFLFILPGTAATTLPALISGYTPCPF